MSVEGGFLQLLKGAFGEAEFAGDVAQGLTLGGVVAVVGEGGGEEGFQQGLLLGGGAVAQAGAKIGQWG